MQDDLPGNVIDYGVAILNNVADEWFAQFTTPKLCLQLIKDAFPWLLKPDLLGIAESICLPLLSSETFFTGDLGFH